MHLFKINFLKTEEDKLRGKIEKSLRGKKLCQEIKEGKPQDIAKFVYIWRV